jgi:putative flippase GtrA
VRVDAAKLTRLVKYAVSGGAAAIVHLLIFSAASRAHVRPVAASAIGFCTAVIVNYLLQYHWTFNHQGSHATAFGRYISVTLLSFAVNLLAFKLLIDHVDLDPLLAQAITIVVVFVFNFGLNSSYSFAAPKSGG